MEYSCPKCACTRWRTVQKGVSCKCRKCGHTNYLNSTAVVKPAVAEPLPKVSIPTHSPRFLDARPLLVRLEEVFPGKSKDFMKWSRKRKRAVMRSIAKA